MDPHILINEVFVNPEGSDLGFEWIEFYNPTKEAVDFMDWSVEAAGKNFALVTTMGETIDTQEYFLLCEPKVLECNLYVEKLGFQNGGSATDGIRLVSNLGETVDELFYDSPNSNFLTDLTGNIVLDSETAEAITSAKSLGRLGIIDNDNSATEFQIFDKPTPGDINEPPTKATTTPSSPTVEPPQLANTGQNLQPFMFLSVIILFFILSKYSAKLSSAFFNLLNDLYGKDKEKAGSEANNDSKNCNGKNSKEGSYQEAFTIHPQD